MSEKINPLGLSDRQLAAHMQQREYQKPAPPVQAGPTGTPGWSPYSDAKVCDSEAVEPLSGLECFCFEVAVQHMRDGHAVRRNSWLGFIWYMLPAQNVIFGSRIYMHPPRLFCARLDSLERERAKLTEDDVVANDWGVYGG